MNCSDIVGDNNSFKTCTCAEPLYYNRCITKWQWAHAPIIKEGMNKWGYHIMKKWIDAWDLEYMLFVRKSALNDWKDRGESRYKLGLEN